MSAGDPPFADVFTGIDWTAEVMELLAGPTGLELSDTTANPVRAWMQGQETWYVVAPGVEPMTFEWGPQDDAHSLRLRLHGNEDKWVDFPLRVGQFAVGPWLVTLEFRSIGKVKGQQVLEATRIAVGPRPARNPIPSQESTSNPPPPGPGAR